MYVEYSPWKVSITAQSVLIIAPFDERRVGKIMSEGQLSALSMNLIRTESIPSKRNSSVLTDNQQLYHSKRDKRAFFLNRAVHSI